MQRLFDEPKHRNILTAGLVMVLGNKRYIGWFWMLNLFLAILGTSAFRESAHTILDHSLYSDRLIDGLHLATLIDLLARPEFGPMITVTTPAVWLACLFFSCYRAIPAWSFCGIRFDLSFATKRFLPGLWTQFVALYPADHHCRHCDGHYRGTTVLGQWSHRH